MGFSENLQNLRKAKNMSQEQFAEQLDVSRQAVSKWESGNGYPETEKLITICELFGCTMDNLIKGKISDCQTIEKKKYENIKNKTNKGISLGIAIILLGVTILLYFAGLSNMADAEKLANEYSTIGVTILLVCIFVSIPFFIILGIEMENFKKKYPNLPDFYSEDEKEKYNHKFSFGLAICVSLILLGVISLVFLHGMNYVSEESTLPIVILMSCITISVPMIVYLALEKDKYNINVYNKINEEETKKREDKTGKICGVIMLSATIIFLLTGFIFNLWHINWLIYPIGGILCGIVSTIVGSDE